MPEKDILNSGSAICGALQRPSRETPQKKGNVNGCFRLEMPTNQEPRKTIAACNAVPVAEIDVAENGLKLGPTVANWTNHKRSCGMSPTCRDVEGAVMDL